MTRPGFVFTPPAIADALTPLNVTVTVAQASVPTYTGSTLYGAEHATFRYIGCGNLSFGAAFPDTLFYASASRYPNTRDSQTSVAAEFRFTGTEFQVRYKFISAAGSKVQVFVDDRPVTARPIAFAGTTPGSIHRMTVNLGTSGTRTIRLMGNSLPFGGVWIQAGDTFAASSAPRMRMAFQGDSLVAGSNMSTIAFWRKFGRYVGADDVWPQAIGGTGFIVPGTATAIGNRTPLDIVQWNPDAVLLWGGYNDVPANSAAAVATAAAAVIDDIQAIADPPQIVVVGAWETAPTASATHVALDNALRDLAIQKACIFVSPITGEVVNRWGNTVATYGKWVTSANAGLVIGSDGIHPTDVGNDLIAQQLYQALVAIEQPIGERIGWVDVGSPLIEQLWPDAANLDADLVEHELYAAYEQLLEYAPALGDAEDPPARYVQAQIMHAADLFAASRRKDGDAIGLSDTGAVVRIPPLEATVALLLRPRKGTPVLG